MAKKKNQSKKHRFKYAASNEGAPVSTLAVSDGGSSIVSNDAPKRVAASSAGSRDFSYVGQDLRRIAILAGSLVALEIVLWYVFGHTSIGNTIYQLVQV